MFDDTYVFIHTVAKLILGQDYMEYIDRFGVVHVLIRTFARFILP